MAEPHRRFGEAIKNGGTDETRTEGPMPRFFEHFVRNVAEPTRLELATSAVTGQRSNQLSYDSVLLLYRTS